MNDTAELDFRFDPENVTGKYVLDEYGEPRPEPHLLRWAEWMERTDRQLLIDRIGASFVSTVFLAIDYGFVRLVNPTAPPVLWETMVFGPSPLNGRQRRYTSRQDAIAGHSVMCELVARFGDPPRRVKKALKKFHKHLNVSRPGDMTRVMRWYRKVSAHEMSRRTVEPVNPSDDGATY